MLTRAETDIEARGAAVAQRAFYAAGGSAAIMNPSHYNPTVIDLLQSEAIALSIALQRGTSCELLVELGCYDGRYLTAADLLRVEYLGIDLDPDAISLLRERLGPSAASAAAIETDILDHHTWVPLIHERNSICLFTFNLLGNLHTPGALLSRLADVGSSVLISGFNTSPAATRARLAYYSSAGVRNLSVREMPGGSVALDGDNGRFSSVALSELVIERMLSDAGFTDISVTTTSISTIAQGRN